MAAAGPPLAALLSRCPRSLPSLAHAAACRPRPYPSQEVPRLRRRIYPGHRRAGSGALCRLLERLQQGSCTGEAGTCPLGGEQDAPAPSSSGPLQCSSRAAGGDAFSVQRRASLLSRRPRGRECLGKRTDRQEGIYASGTMLARMMACGVTIGHLQNSSRFFGRRAGPTHSTDCVGARV